MRNYLTTGGKSQLTAFPEEEGIVSGMYSMEEKQRSGNHGRKRSAGRNRKINDCGLGGKNGNLLNILRQAGRNRGAEYCITSVPYRVQKFRE